MVVLGIDEVGRGPLAGPLVVGAVILPKEKPEWVGELRDSKKLSAKKRETLSELILQEASATGLGWISSEELDKIGISEALRLATKRAVKSIQKLHKPFSQIVIDGKVNFLRLTSFEKYVSVMPKADDLIKEVSAASIIAKVARDRYMCEIAKKYPEYGFEKHVGYGTLKHREAIKKFGICPEHRRSFEPIKSMIGFEPRKNAHKNTTNIGRKAEERVAEYLRLKGHKILARNYKTKYYEIDIVSVYGGNLYFTEVKYRKNAEFGGGFEAITIDKQKRMEFAAQAFLKCHSEFHNNDSSLAVASVSGDEFAIDDWFSI